MSENDFPVAYTITLGRITALRPCAKGLEHFREEYIRRYGNLPGNSEPFPLERVAWCVRDADDLRWLLIALFSDYDSRPTVQASRARRMYERMCFVKEVFCERDSVQNNREQLALFVAMSRHGEDASFRIDLRP